MMNKENNNTRHTYKDKWLGILQFGMEVKKNES